MPSTRRVFLAAALAAAAGCSASPGGDGTSADGTTTSPTGSTTIPGGGSATTPGAVPERWSYEPPFDEVGTLSLAPGADGPAVYVGSAGTGNPVTGETPANHDQALVAVSLADGTEQWQLPLPGPPRTPPMYGGGPPRLYLESAWTSLHGRGARLHAVDPTRGEEAWTFDTEERRFVYPLATTEDAVFVGRRDDQLAGEGEYLYAVEAADGAERWRIEAGDAPHRGHAVRRDTLMVNTYGGFRAIDPGSGEERWRAGDGSPVDGPAYGSRGERVFLGDDGVVRGLAVADGAEQWRRAFDFHVSDVARPREAMSTTVYVGDYDGRLLALSPLDGTTRWTYAVDGDGFYPRVRRTSESLFLGSVGVHALDPVSGEARWSFTPDVDASFHVHASTTVFARAGDRVWALDPANGEVRWRYDAGSGIRGMANAGDLAFVADGGTVRALDGRADR